MKKTIIKTKKEKASKAISGQFYQAPVSVDTTSVVVKLPLDVAKYLGISDNIVYWAAVNGVVQLSGAEPNIVIPMIGVRANSFVSQS